MARIYLPGEVWHYASRDSEPHARCFIVKIDRQENGEEIFHIALDNLAIQGPDLEDGAPGVLTVIGHLPVSRQCLEASLTQRATFAGEVPDVDDGYRRWHEAFKAGEAGVFDIPLATIVEVMERAVQDGDEIDAIDSE